MTTKAMAIPVVDHRAGWVSFWLQSITDWRLSIWPDDFCSSYYLQDGIVGFIRTLFARKGGWFCGATMRTPPTKTPSWRQPTPPCRCETCWSAKEF
jgi:hypothetical protein